MPDNSIVIVNRGKSWRCKWLTVLLLLGFTLACKEPLPLDTTGWERMQVPAELDLSSYKEFVTTPEIGLLILSDGVLRYHNGRWSRLPIEGYTSSYCAGDVTPEGEIWVSGNRGYLAHGTVDGLKSIQFKEQPYDEMCSLAATADDVWVSWFSDELKRWNGEKWTKEKPPELESLGIGALLSFPDGTLFASEFAGPVIRRKGELWETYEVGPLPRVTSLHGSSSSDVWVVGWWASGGIWKKAMSAHFDGTKWRTYDVSQWERLYSVYAVSPTEAWAGGPDGLLLHWQNNTWTPVPSPTHNSIFLLTQTSDGRLWMKTRKGELFRQKL